MARPNNQEAIQLHLRGLREAKAAFQAMPEEFRKALNDATAETGAAIVRKAQAYLRSSPAIRTRSLHDHVAFTLNKKSGRGRVGVASGTSTIAGDARIGTIDVKVKGIVVAGRGGSALHSQGARLIKPSRYAHLIEFGTEHSPAEPFMLPASESEKQPFLERCRDAGITADKALAALYREPT